MSKISAVCGIHAVESVFRNDPQRIDRIWCRQGKPNARLEKVLQQAKSHNIAIEIAEDKQLSKLAETEKHQGIVAMCHEALQMNESDLLNFIEKLDEPAFLLILDGVTDPHNLGACLRTADAVGVHAVIVPKDHAVGLTPVVRKVASGAAETVPFVAVTNLARTMDQLKAMGIWMTGLADQAASDLHQHDLKGPVAIVMGTEGKGLRQKTLEYCDFRVAIPMCGQVESLNVSVATAVVLYEALRQRKAV